MSNPVLLAVDDDAQVLRAISRDLRRKYADSYRIMRADSGESALQAATDLKSRNQSVALFLVDQRMPGLSGVQFLQQARELHPNAKRVLLTAYSDMQAAIDAINEVNLDYYLLKPWDPPETKLYPALDDLLSDWQATYRPAFDGIRIIGTRWSADCHRLKEFLTRNRVPYRWLDIETDAAACEPYLTDGRGNLPAVCLPNGEVLQNPSIAMLAEATKMTTRADKPFYDFIIAGGGPAGLAAAVYGASEGLKTLMIERAAPGGQAGTSSRIENYLGFPVGLSGADLARRAFDQARRFNVEIISPQEVIGLGVNEQYRVVKLADGSEVGCHALLIATGVSYRKLDVPGIEQFDGRGVYYGAAASEIMNCRDDTIFIVGGANSAGQSAMHFSSVARNVVMLLRGESLSAGMSQYLIDAISATPNIQVIPFSQIVEAHGQDHLESLTIANTRTGKTQTQPANGLFIFIGAQPHTDWLEGVIERDSNGYILTGSDLMVEGKPPRNWVHERLPFLLETNIAGVFAAGDVRHGSIKRVASGVGEGSICVSFVHRHLADLG